MPCCKRTDCNFVAKSSQGLGVHRSKKHIVNDSLSTNAVSVSVVREYPERRSFYCCLCDSIVLNFQHLTCHFKKPHPGIKILSSARCSVCGNEFSSGQGAGVHVSRTICGRSKLPVADEPIMSIATYRDDESTSDITDFHANNTPSPSQSPPPQSPTPLDPAAALSGCTVDERVPFTLPSSDITPVDNTSTVVLNDCTVEESSTPKVLTSPIQPATLEDLSIEDDNDPFDIPRPLFLDSYFQSTSLNPSAPAFHPTPPPEPTPTPDYPSSPAPIPSDIGSSSSITPPPPSLSSPAQSSNPNTPTPSHLPILEAVVVPSDCNAVNSNAPLSTFPCPTNPPPPPNPSPPQSSCPYPPNLNQHRPPEPTVALNGCTAGDGTGGPLLSSPTTASQNPFIIPPPLADTSFLTPTVTPSFHSDNVNNHHAKPPTSSPSSNPPPLSSNPNHTDPIIEFQSKWSAAPSADCGWDQFAKNCDDFAEDVIKTSEIDFQRKKPAPRRSNRPSARPVNPNRRPVKYNPIQARKLQSLYRISKKRAARKVLNDSKPSYDGSVDDANEFFTRVFGPKSCDIEGVKSGLNDFVPSGPADNHLADHLSPDEIKKKLRVLSNSAPGADRVEYLHLKSVDPNCKILCSIYNRCPDANDVPQQWKNANTILIHKKGDSGEISNFRPIALMSCIYKLFMSVIANRLVNFAVVNELLSDSQKSARPSEGCYEHTFLLQSLLPDAKRLQKNVCLAWLDLRNAFGSVPHDVIKLTLSHLGAPQSLVDLISNVYTGATTVIRTPAGDTNNIPILSGVKQGCPLSPILFNLSVEIILRAVLAKANSIGPAKHHGLPISVLAYADDLVLICRDRKKLQQLLDAAGETATLIGLEFRPDKCASLCVTYSKRVEGNIQLVDFSVQDRITAALNQHEHYRYLGVPIGMMRDIDSLDHLVDDLRQDLDRINSSLLAPWQKLDAIRTFVQPSLTFALRAGDPEKASLVKYRQKLIEIVRNICNLPNRASQSIIFASTKVGGLALQDPLVELDIQTTVQAIKMLSSNDPSVSTAAKSELKQSVRFAARADPSPALIQDFLSGSTKGAFHPDPTRYRTHSLWTRARKACRNLKISFQVPDFNPPFLTLDYGSPVLAKLACTKLHHLCQDRAADKLLPPPDQGKVARALVKDHSGNGSSWIYSGLNIRFKDWRFVHRARLNLVPTNQNKHRWDDPQSPICRVRNTDPETLPHILCHCPTNLVDVRGRHNAILGRLTNAIRYGKVRVDQQIPELNDECRPDIVIMENNEVTVIDVVCPFENGDDALKSAEDRKVNKYSHLVDHFKHEGKVCRVYGFVVGALGAWHPNNEAVLSQIRMSLSYRKLFRKLCCSDAIKHSADIYYKHISQ